MRILLVFIGLLAFQQVAAREPSQAPANKISVSYKLFPPFGNTSVSISVNDEGYINVLSISTEIKIIDISENELTKFRYPSLPDIEIMHFGEATENGIGGTFSLCIPYGKITRVSGKDYWQRPVLAVFVTPDQQRIRDVPLPKEGTEYGEYNGCEISAQEIFGF